MKINHGIRRYAYDNAKQSTSVTKNKVQIIEYLTYYILYYVGI